MGGFSWRGEVKVLYFLKGAGFGFRVSHCMGGREGGEFGVKEIFRV